ncbi:hypothetical protein MMC17_005536 [Xylographa soralifera]|nr:hypothetical protein [Xylographa soralifera]
MDESTSTAQHDFADGILNDNNNNAVPITADNSHDDPTAPVDENRGKLYDTPPDSYAEAVSPLTSRKHGKLRAESLGISPSAGRGLSAGSAVPTMASQQRLAPLDLANAQSDTMTVPRPDVIREPLPCVPPQSIAQRLDGQVLGFSETRGHNVPALRLDRGCLPYLDTSFVIPRTVQDSESPDVANPYEDRADEIGPAHGIPGVGHLGDLLTPPGWVEGMSLINPKQVKQLYDMARKKAREALTAEAVDWDGLGPQERATKEKARNKKWETELKLEKLLMMERLAVYRAYEVSSSKVASGHAFAQGLEVPATLDPPTQTSIPYQHDTLRPEIPALFQPNHGPMRPSLHTTQARAQFRSTHVGFASPTALDPSLATESLELVMARHAQKKDKLLRELRENDRLLSMFLEKYGYQFSRGPISPGARLPVSDQQNGSFQFGRAGDPRTLPRPLPYVSPTAPNFGNSPMISPVFNNMAQSFPPGPELSRYGVEDSMLHGHPNNIAPNSIPGLHGNLQSMYNLNSGTNEPLNTTTAAKKKRASKKKAEAHKPEIQKGEKRKPWYHDQVVRANIPTSVLSAEAMQAGIDFGNRGVTAKQVKANTKQASSSPKKRRGKEINPPEEGFLISKEGTVQLQDAYAKGTMHPGMRGLWDAALKAGRLNGLPGQTPFNSSYNDSANTNNVNFVYSPRPRGNLAPSFMGSHHLPNTANPFAKDPEVRNQELENRWQPLVSHETNQMQHNSGSNDVTPKNASHAREVTDTNPEESSELSTATSSEDDDENDLTFGKKSTRTKGSASKRQGSSSVKRKATTQMAGSKRPRAASGPQQIDGAIDLTCSPTPNQKLCGTRDMKS